MNPFSEVKSPPPANRLVNSAIRKAFRVAPKKRKLLIENARAREILRVKTMFSTVCDALKLVVRSYPNISEVHPFYRELASLVVNVDELRHSLGALEWASRALRSVMREVVSELRRADNTEEMRKIRNRGIARLSSLVDRIRNEIEYVRKSSKRLRALPNVDTSSLSVIVAGMPNTGKSSLMRKLSSGNPEVAPYPFTTKGVLIGHKDVVGIGRIQYVDTPGLLDRPLSGRNEMELQAIAAMKYLDGIVLFLIDPTESCGFTIEEQTRVLNEIKDFLKKPMLIVLNKKDIWNDECRKRAEFLRKDSVEISALTGEGILDLERKVSDLLKEVFLKRLRAP